MGKRKVLLPAAMLLSALSALAGMLPYILIWLIVRELLEHGEITSSGNVVTYAWWAAGMAVASIVLYFAALMSSHLAAFRVESNLRKEAMRQIVRMPLGFFDINTSGRIRKIIDDNAGVTHSFLAHQLPDLAATFLVPLVAAILIFVFDWILGLACIVPVIIAMLVMGFMMNAEEQMHVLDVRPGITDLASLRYRNENELLERVNDPDKYYVEVIMPDKLRINLEYVARHSFTFDIRLIFQTFRAIVSE